MANQYKNMSREYLARQSLKWRIRYEYPAAALAREEILESSPAPPDGVLGGRRVRDPVLEKAAKLAEIDAFVSAVDGGLLVIPEEYRGGVWDHVLKGSRWPIYAARSTWERWERRYLMAVIRRLEE